MREIGEIANVENSAITDLTESLPNEISYRQEKEKEIVPQSIDMNNFSESIDNLIELVVRKGFNKDITLQEIKKTGLSKNTVNCVKHYFKAPTDSPLMGLGVSIILFMVIVFTSKDIKEEKHEIR